MNKNTMIEMTISKMIAEADRAKNMTNDEIISFLIENIWSGFDLHSKESAVLDEVIKRLKNMKPLKPCEVCASFYIHGLNYCGVCGRKQGR